MISFTIALLLLVVGYFTYGKLIERIVKPDSLRKTPAYKNYDGVDYLPLPTWKIFMIQFLNIAGLGPIFGAIMGAKFGVSSYLWIVFGTIFAGAVHDYIAGMFSERFHGESLPNIVGLYLGPTTKRVMIVFTMVLMILVGAVFMSGPAELLAGYTPEWMDAYFWIAVIFVYYIVATLFPIDAIIGRIYPFFAFVLLFMAVGLLVMLFVKWPSLPEVWNGMGVKYESSPIFPMMFVSIACGAISGFHATQSPLMARCMKNEKYGRPVFYGAMVTEGIVALIWAAVATWFFGKYGTVNPETGAPFSAAYIAKFVTQDWLGTVGGILAVLGIVAAPITSGDTALRSARLIIADFLHINQLKISKRLWVSIPLFALTFLVLWFSLSNKDGFAIIWRYFAWSNQALSVFTLWAITIYLLYSKKFFYVTLVPALFMTFVCTTYLFYAPECLDLGVTVSYLAGIVAVLVSLLLFIRTKRWFDMESRQIM